MLQNANTDQTAIGIAKSDQTAVNANVPVSIAGGNVYSGPSSATQTATSNATADVSNKAKTDQDQHLSQNIGGGSCLAGCGGAGGFQLGVQNAETNQWAARSRVQQPERRELERAQLDCRREHLLRPELGDADGDLERHHRRLEHGQDRPEPVAESAPGRKDCCERKGSDDLSVGSGGAGGFQVGVQNAETNQGALGISASNQNAVNGNSPASTAGGNIYSGPSSATQTATSNAYTDVSNKAKTDQDQGLKQDIGGKGLRLQGRP